MPLLDIVVDQKDTTNILELPQGANGTVIDIVADGSSEAIIELKIVASEGSGPTYYSY